MGFLPSQSDWETIVFGKTKHLLAAFAALILAGFIQPLDTSLVSTSSTVIGVLALAVWFAPASPMVFVCLGAGLKTTVSPVWIRVLAVALCGVGVCLTLLGVAFAPPGAGLLSALHGGGLTLAVVASLLCMTPKWLSARAARLAAVGVGLSSLLAIWSLLSVPAVLFQARAVAAGAPYCIAQHGPSRKVETLWDLRGFSFYTRVSGSKDSSGWYFHGVLTVEGAAGRQYFNWSPRHLRFDRIEHPDRFIASVQNLCSPKLAQGGGMNVRRYSSARSAVPGPRPFRVVVPS
ncbi:hypothetical protein [Pseudophaeobacter sp. EL27]|uniref:hypothetical protein n=1 Tax=Pseudophaeobacter sp. EL27 TaxID=2107580 RepID=UPI000EFD7CE0|nr:hypothetical protein [Pseudophaeobacter sp. EL27]